MSFLYSALIAVQVISSLTIIVLVMLQQGKGSEMGAAFGSGSAGGLFGAAGAANFLSRSTRWAAIVFFASTLGLAYFGSHQAGLFGGGVMNNVTTDQSVQTPTPAPSAVPGQPAQAPSQAASQTGNSGSEAGVLNLPEGASGKASGDLSIPFSAPAQQKK